MKDLEYAELVANVLELRDSMNLSDEMVALLLVSRDKAICRSSLIGKHKCSVVLEIPTLSATPYHTTKSKISCDICLRSELKALNALKVNTVGSCCGHGVNQAFIQVDDSSVELMQKMGYEQLPVDKHGNGINCFKPKTLFLEKGNN